MSLEPRRVFLTAEWRHLAMLNYEVSEDLLKPYLPRGTELDRWNGRLYVSLVAFRFLNTKVLGIPIPFHRDFDEINLRFYVTRQEEDGLRRGVVFIKEVVPRWAIAAVARWVYNENYVACRTRSSIVLPNGNRGSLRYGWHPSKGEELSLGVDISGAAQPLEAGSEEEFITEHYWGYAAQRDGGTVEYQVEHPPWTVWRAERSELTGPVGAFYGSAFEAPLRQPPTSAFVATGSAVTVRRGRRLPASGVSAASREP